MTIAWSRAWGESWGLSWGLTYEANQDELLSNGGGPDAADGLDETEQELEHQKSFDRFKRVAYPLPAIPTAVVPTETPSEAFSTSPAIPKALPSPGAALSILLPKATLPAAEIHPDPAIQRNKDEEALLLILLEA